MVENEETGLSSNKQKSKIKKNYTRETKIRPSILNAYDRTSNPEYFTMVQNVIRVKIILMGDVFVGKTSIIHKFVEERTIEEHVSTLAVQYKVKSLKFDEDNRVMDMLIWDTFGNPKFRSFCKQYYRDANGILLVFDITKRETFLTINSFLTEIRENATSNTCILIVGNKSDLYDAREVSYVEADTYSKDNNCKYLEVSAKNGNNLNYLFEEIGIDMYNEILNQMENETHENKQVQTIDESALRGSNFSLDKSKHTKSHDLSLNIMPNKKKCC